MGKFGKRDSGDADEGQRGKIEKAWELYSGPGLSPLVFALASLVFNEKYWQAVSRRDWKVVIGEPLEAWLGFFAFWTIVVSFFGSAIMERPWFEKMGRWKGAIAAGFAVFVFVCVRYILHSMAQ